MTQDKHKRKNAAAPTEQEKKKEIAQLKRQLKQAQIAAEAYFEMIKFAEREYEISILRKDKSKS